MAVRSTSFRLLPTSTAIGDPATFNHKLDELQNHSEGYAQNISDARMAGFDVAVSRFEGAGKNLESAKRAVTATQQWAVSMRRDYSPR